MAEYRLPLNSWEGAKIRTPAYQFTVYDLDDPLLLSLRREVKRNNKAMRALARQTEREYYADNLKRVRIMPRGARMEAAWDDYKSRRAYDSYLPMRHGTRFDVYIQADDKAYQLKEEIRYGITPGIRAKLNQQSRARMELEVEHYKSMRAHGFYQYNNQWMTLEAAAEAMLEDGLPEQYIARVTRNG